MRRAFGGFFRVHVGRTVSGQEHESGDRNATGYGLKLPGDQQELVRRVQQANARTVVVLIPAPPLTVHHSLYKQYHTLSLCMRLGFGSLQNMISIETKIIAKHETQLIREMVGCRLRISYCRTHRKH